MPTETPAPPDLEILPGQIEGPLRFETLFGRIAPVEAEIGIGKGRFILAEASLRRDVDFLGLEWSLKHLRIARDRASKLGLANVRFHRADARHVFADLIADAALQRVHVYCPDPWPKKRHHKRRLFNAEMARHLERVLAPGGHLNVSTDVKEYFDAIVETVDAATGLRRAVDPIYPADAATGLTNYETKYLAAGRVIHRATWRREPGGGIRNAGSPNGA
ncbi:MAG TPA: tRNA (guanosine(46)-N7)-methyltransferase TrmB [Patescibacteria group bacterium]|nr:tRNA (guanosine(46)-N7)-methyltransferase TrmB [Patescibacteria group bacterium]